jgi:uncharacterized protein YdaU (DUF1376 family)/coenzyme F420-reducing hydrogenase delta subunit
MANSPWFKMYAGDFLTDTNAWDVVEVGIYIRLLCTQWVNGGLPNDMARLARVCGVNKELFVEAWKYIGEKFILCGDGLLRNGKMEEVRMAGAAYTIKKKMAGAAGGKAKAKQTSSKSVANGEQSDSKDVTENKQTSSKSVADGEQVDSISVAEIVADSIATSKQTDSKSVAIISEFEHEYDYRNENSFKGGAGGNFLSGVEILPIEECKQRYMSGNECASGREVLLKRVMDAWGLNKASGEERLWKLAEEFNDTLRTKLVMVKPLGDWGSYLNNWINIKIQKNASGNNGTGKSGSARISGFKGVTVGDGKGFFD